MENIWQELGLQFPWSCARVVNIIGRGDSVVL